MFLSICAFVILGFPVVLADGWDGFSDNLATDLAPFLSLFGEQVTKQYLSESIQFRDYLIFAIGPMGILTALVSAIRVCGSPSLRAFIGRAQEGGGVAEAELCSSTSRDVCELYNNGGIARVFGRPKILEVIYDPDHENSPDETAGIYTLQEYLNNKGKKNWYRREGKQRGDTESDPKGKPPVRAFAPNLSLNIGIKKQSQAIFNTVAYGGLVLQIGVLVFAAIVTYYLKWGKGSSHPEAYACPLVIIGTILVCSGMFFCASLIGQSTEEEVWGRKGTDKASIHWLQPGGQVIGDQTFDAFAYSDRDNEEDYLEEYIISWKKKRSEKIEWAAWATAGVTVCGFVLQFTGLRGIHSAVSVAQLGVAMVMGMARAALRMRRLNPKANSFATYLDEVIGHELDWLALRIAQDHLRHDLGPLSAGLSPAVSLSSSSATFPADGRCRYFWKFCGTARTTHITEAPSRSNDLNPAARLLAYRTRLAKLTESPSPQSKSMTSARNFEIRMVEVRHMAQQLTLAIESAANVIFSESAKIQGAWEKAEVMQWGIQCEVTKKLSTDLAPQKQHTVFLQLSRETNNANSLTSPWRMRNPLELEGLLGLWLWSLKSDPAVEKRDAQSELTISKATEVPARRIVSTNQQMAESDLKIWLAGKPSSLVKGTLQLPHIGAGDPSTIWTVKEKDSYEPLSSRLPEGFDKQTMRLFGWYAADFPQCQPLEYTRIWTVPTNGSLLSQCAQEAFGSFLKSILCVVEDTGGIVIKEESQHFRLENHLVSKIAESFTQSQLGTEHEGLLCILPVVLPRLSEASSQSALAAGKKSANQYRQQKKWKEAERILRWVWSICTARMPIQSHNMLELAENATVALGELYRTALRDGKTRLSTSEGMQWLKDQIESASLPQSGSLKIILDRYLKITETRNGASIDLLSGIKCGNLTETLIYLTHNTIEDPEKGNALCFAAKQGWCEVVLDLLELGAEPDYKDSSSRTALSYAAQCGSADTVVELMNWGASPNSEDSNHRAPLSYASEAGHISVVKVLLADTRIFLDSSDKNRWTALTWAAQNGHKEIVKMLLDKGAYVGFRDTLLLRASENGHKEIVQMLLDQGADVNARNEYGQTSLICASIEGHKEIAQMLLDKGADVNAPYKDGKTPLVLASLFGHKEIALMLLDKGAGVNARNEDVKSVLRHASKDGHKEIVKTLLDKGADVNAPNEYGNTPLLFASLNGHREIAQMLLDKGADVNARNKDGNTPLLCASSNGHKEIAQMLLDKGADVNARNKDGDTPLLCASSNGHKEIAQMLLDKGADVNARNKDGNTPLLLASIEGHKEIVPVLLGKGADINAPNEYGNTPLLCVSLFGHKEIAQMLLDDGADVNARNKDGNTPLFCASLFGHREIALMLLDKGADVNARNKDGTTPLIWPSFEGQQEIAQMLVDKGADVNVQGDDGDTPLLCASINGHKEIAQMLLDEGADVNARNKNGNTPLLLASLNGHQEIVPVLLGKGADINAPNEYGNTPLLCASMNGHKEIAQMLLDEGADVNARNKNGNTPLLLASLNGHQEIVPVFLGKGADINAPNEYGNTPLLCASSNGHKEIAQMLLDEGADVNARNKDGTTPLVWASIEGHKEIAQILLDKEADVDVQDDDGDTPLLCASRNGHKEIAQMLLDKGADVNARNKDGKTSLIWASIEGHKEIAQILLDKEADVDVQDDDGDTPLLCASRNGHKEIALMLLDKGADVNARNKDGNTPLLCASSNGHKEFAQMLLDEGADVNARNKDGNTPLLCASSNGHKEIAQMLLDKGADVNARNKDGKTSLIWASIEGHKEIAQILLDKEADVDVQDDDGDTPLLCASRNGHKEIALMLLDKEADVNARNKDGNTPLTWASKNGHKKIVQMLLEKGADISIQDKNGPLMEGSK
jgi:ankyrin repeat protein